MNWQPALDWGILGPALRRRPAGAGDARAAGHAGAGARHRLHRPGDRADRRARRDRGRCARLRASRAARCRSRRSAAALLGALLLTWTERRWPEQQEALIGVLFVLAACGGILLLANNPHGGEHLKDLLVGQILWVTTPQLVAACWSVTAAGARACGSRWPCALGPLRLLRAVRAGGDRVGAAGRRVPGVRQPDRSGAGDQCNGESPRSLLAGFSIGAAGYAVGLAMSSLIDLPSGPLIVLIMTALAIAAAGMVAYLKPRSHRCYESAAPVIVPCKARAARGVRAALRLRWRAQRDSNQIPSLRPSRAPRTARGQGAA